MGTVLFLGGPSFFYFTGLPLGIIGAFLLLYSLFSIHHFTMEKNGTEITFAESYLLFGFKYFVIRKSLPISKIQTIQIQTNKRPIHYVWYAIFLPMIVGLIQYGIPMLLNNRAHTPALPLMLIFNAVVQIVGLYLLIHFNPASFHTLFSDGYLESSLPYFSHSNRPDWVRIIIEFVNTHLFPNPSGWNVNNFNHKPIRNKYFLTKKGIFGFYLILIALISAFGQMFFGFIFWMYALVCGFIILTHSFTVQKIVLGIGIPNKNLESSKISSIPLFEKCGIVILFGIGGFQVGFNGLFLQISDLASSVEFFGSLLLLGIGIFLLKWTRKNG
jgi:hypothetical protein